MTRRLRTHRTILGRGYDWSRARKKACARDRALGFTQEGVYQVVDERAGGYCEVVLQGARCRKRSTDHHHTLKPRRSYHEPEWVMAICRAHHDRVDWPYSRGRLVTRPNGDGTFACAIVTAPDKFTYRHRHQEAFR